MIVTTDNANYTAIADAIRAKNGTDETYTPAAMAAAIEAIQAGGMECVPGTFTASDDETQKTFTVSGLIFEPKLITITRTSITEGTAGAGTAQLLTCAFSDLENSTGFYMASSTTTGALKASSCLSVSGSNGTFTITSTQAFSSYSSTTRFTYGKYSYRIYG